MKDGPAEREITVSDNQAQVAAVKDLYCWGWLVGWGGHQIQVKSRKRGGEIACTGGATSKTVSLKGSGGDNNAFIKSVN